VASAAAAWAGAIRLEPSEFERFLAARMPADDRAAALVRLHLGDLYLACGCLRGLPAAIAAFESEVMGPVAAALRRFRLDRLTAEELAQNVREKLLVGAPGAAPKIVEYAGRGPLQGWVRVVAIRTAINWLRDQRAGAPLDDLVQAGGRNDPETFYLRGQYGAALDQAIDHSMRTLRPEQRVLLRMYYLEGLSTRELGKIFRKHPVTIMRSLKGIVHALRLRTNRFLQAQLHCDRSVADSIVKLVLSQIDLNVQRWLPADPRNAPPESGP
jgi:RNA polymerase sigma-70 factor (ECF subfamily)